MTAGRLETLTVNSFPSLQPIFKGVLINHCTVFTFFRNKIAVKNEEPGLPRQKKLRLTMIVIAVEILKIRSLLSGIAFAFLAH